MKKIDWWFFGIVAGIILTLSVSSFAEETAKDQTNSYITFVDTNEDDEPFGEDFLVIPVEAWKDFTASEARDIAAISGVCGITYNDITPCHEIVKKVYPKSLMRYFTGTGKKATEIREAIMKREEIK